MLRELIGMDIFLEIFCQGFFQAFSCSGFFILLFRRELLPCAFSQGEFTSVSCGQFIGALFVMAFLRGLLISCFFCEVF